MANGRLGFKCIPPYTSCEIYQNSSGSEASVSIGAQGLNASVNNKISVAVATTAYTLVCSQNEATGTNCFKDTSAITVAGAGQTDPHGAWIQTSTAIGGTVSTRPTSFMNVNGTRTSIGGTALRSPAAYGGSEYILPGESQFNDFMDNLTDDGTGHSMSHCNGFMVYDCHGIQPLFIGAKNFCCCCEFAGAMFINPQCDCAGAAYGYGAGQSSCCSICWQSFGNIGSFTKKHLSVINHYAAPFYADPSGTCIAVTGGEFCMKCCDGSSTVPCVQAPIVGFTCGTSSTPGTGTDVCSFAVRMGGCCCSGNCWFGFFNLLACCCNGSTCQRISTVVSACVGTFACSQHCCNMDTTNLMSPYGVARAATFGESLFAVRTCGGATKYVSAYPACNFNQLQSCCNCVNWEVFTIRTPHACEYPIKYLAFNPNESVKKTYFMVRSTTSSNCGIFEYKWADYDGPDSCTGEIICVIPGSNQNALFERKTITDSPFVDKIADFPAAMTANKYTSPLMCVGCLYRMSPAINPFWSITVYNHDTSEWDRFTTTDLINWKSVAPDFRWDVSSTFSYLTFDNCLRTSCNNFENVVPKCGYLDFEVSANNFERTGVVISDGESVVVNNNTTESLAAQVWGYEG